MLVQLKVIFTKQKETILLDMIGSVSLLFIFATSLHIPILF